MRPRGAAAKTTDTGTNAKVLVSDGTMARDSKLALVARPEGYAELLGRTGRARSRTSMARLYFATIRASEAEVLAVVHRMELDLIYPRRWRSCAGCGVSLSPRPMRLVHQASARHRGSRVKFLQPGEVRGGKDS